MIRGLESLALGKTEGARSLLPGEETARQGPHHSIPVLEGQLQRGWRLPLAKEPHGKDKGHQVQVGRGEVSSRYQKEIGNHHSLEQPPRRDGGVPITGGFEDAVGQGAR